ncbi:hypothetical protein AFCA_007307 [Aspergillus flavus]|nr:hypothetical protein AFCA_007307 [Aspergillus flavus]
MLNQPNLHSLRLNSYPLYFLNYLRTSTPRAMSSLYIPPDGVRFRLISVASPMCVVADNPLRAYTKENKFEDQWWTLEKSPNQLSSELYFITAAGGYYRGKVLGLWAGHLDYNVWLDDRKHPNLSQRLAFVPGAGPYKDCFRLINHEEKQFEKDGGRVIGATRYERVYCEVESTNRDDQWFTFEIEEAAIDKVDYDIERGTITEGSPVVVTSWTSNASDKVVSNTVNLSKTVTEKSSFEHSEGFSITVGTTAKIGIPFLSDMEIKFEASNTVEWSWGEEHSVEHKFETSVTVDVDPHTEVEVKGIINTYTIDVPCTIYSTTRDGRSVVTKSTYKNISATDMKSEVGEEKPFP